MTELEQTAQSGASGATFRYYTVGQNFRLSVLRGAQAVHVREARRQSWLFTGSDRGGERAATVYSLTVTAKINEIDPQAWLVGVLDRIADHPATKLDELLPLNWRPVGAAVSRAA